MPVRYPREQMHRIKYTKLTLEQIGAKLAILGGPISATIERTVYRRDP